MPAVKPIANIPSTLMKTHSSLPQTHHLMLPSIGCNLRLIKFETKATLPRAGAMLCGFYIITEILSKRVRSTSANTPPLTVAPPITRITNNRFVVFTICECIFTLYVAAMIKWNLWIETYIYCLIDQTYATLARLFALSTLTFKFASKDVIAENRR